LFGASYFFPWRLIAKKNGNKKNPELELGKTTGAAARVDKKNKQPQSYPIFFLLMRARCVCGYVFWVLCWVLF
jgi:hypothetical protein